LASRPSFYVDFPLIYSPIMLGSSFYLYHAWFTAKQLLFNPSYPCVFVCFVFPGYYDVVCFVSSSIYFLYESLIWNLVAGTVSKWPQLCKLIYIYIDLRGGFIRPFLLLSRILYQGLFCRFRWRMRITICVIVCFLFLIFQTRLARHAKKIYASWTMIVLKKCMVYAFTAGFGLFLAMSVKILLPIKIHF
jgi:hypothetical protein